MIIVIVNTGLETENLEQMIGEIWPDVQIVDALVDHLAANTDAMANNVHKRYLYMNEVNDFPTITF